MITKETVYNVAKLARLSITDEEADALTGQLSAVLDYAQQLSSVNTDGVEPTCFVVPGHDPLRDDVVVPSLPLEQLTANGPSVKKGHFAIPKVIG
jgi:aspartyl-tRNA(Asn)/glutamyl-tRNA(Gln) amidotransferase subunit C